jgi:membrane-associated protease RseP (regulator of RpoE activity)
MRTVLSLLVLAALVVGSARPADVPRIEKKPEEKATVVPFEMLKSGHMAVMVKFNGKGPYKMIFDTGAPTNLVNNKVAKEAGLLKGKAKPAFTLFGSQGEAVIDSLEVGDQKAEKVSTMVMDHPTIEQVSKALNTPIEGLIGFPFFGKFKTTIDYQAKTMTFVPNGYNPPNIMEAMMGALMSSDGPKLLSPAAAWGFNAELKDKDTPGVAIIAVRPDSPAAKGGLKVGDRLLTLDGRWTDTMVDLFQAAAGVKPGTEVVLKVQRDGKEVKLKVAPVAGL